MPEIQFFSEQMQQEIADFMKEKFDQAVDEAAEMKQKRYFTKSEAIEYLTLKTTSFNDYVRYSVPVATVGGRLIFDRKDLDEFIEQHKV